MLSERMPDAICCVRAESPLISVTVLANPASVDTCMVYDAAIAVALQERVGVSAVFSVPVAGVARATAGDRFGMVVKFQTFDHEPVPEAFVAFTRQ